MKLYARSLTKYFGRVAALVDVDFDINAKRIAIIGQNGSGKSTLLSIIYGLLHPSRGVLKVNGYEPYNERERASMEMSIAFERPRFDINVRVRDVYKIIREYGDRDCLEMFWEQIGVKSFGEMLLPDLSSGQKQLVQLMQALCKDSRIKVLDEPFSHLDVRNMGLIGDYILSRNFSAILTTHVPEEAEWIGEYFVMLKEGKIVWHGRIEELQEQGVYEVYLRQYLPESLEVILKLGYVAIVKSSYEELLELVERDKIRGFKKLGVRRYF